MPLGASRNLERDMTNGEWGLLIGLGFGISAGFWTVERKLNAILQLLSR
jgi:hypothetical protein